jgi:hypothetical protein
MNNNRNFYEKAVIFILKLLSEVKGIAITFR